MDENSVQFGLSTILTISTVELFIGTLIGWYLRSRKPEAAAEDAETVRLREKQRRQGEYLERMLDQVCRLAGNIGKDVGAHSSRVQQIGDALQSAAEQPLADLHSALVVAVSSVTDANEELQQRLSDAEQKLIDQSSELQAQVAMARTDKLTGLLNRRACDDSLVQRLGEFQRYGATFSMLLIDIDRFKSINDTYGHQAGDEVLQRVARVLEQSMRDVDIVYRFGGEEFAILMPATDLEGASTAAERARKQFELAAIEHAGKTLRVTFSGGVATVMVGETAANLIGRADRALYAAKRAGRNCVHVHDGVDCFPLNESVPEQTDPSESPVPTAENSSSEQPNDQPIAAMAADLPEAITDFAKFTKQLQAGVESRRRHGTRASIVVGCVDQHVAAASGSNLQSVDYSVRAAMQVVRAALREADTMVRIGKDQIGLVLSSVSTTRVVAIVERVRAAIEKCHLHLPDEQVLKFTMRFAVVEIGSNDDGQACLTRAFDALEATAAAGGNRTQLVPAEQPLVSAS